MNNKIIQTCTKLGDNLIPSTPNPDTRQNTQLSPTRTVLQDMNVMFLPRPFCHVEIIASYPIINHRITWNH